VLRQYNLLENVLIDIEKGIREGINSDILAEKYTLSERHLRKLFKFAFKQSMGSYIRSRKLAASLDDLLKTDANILDIALDCNFSYEQSYINAFKCEFGITPGDFRKTGHIVKIKPPLRLFDENKFPDGLFLGPDIVMVPQFHVIGKLHRIPFGDSLTLGPKVTIQFCENNRSQINEMAKSSAFYGITRNMNFEGEYNNFLTSFQVENLKNIPQGFCGDTFDASLCARFRYIGEHHYYDINCNVLSGLYNKILEFANDDKVNYTLLYDQAILTKIDKSLYDGKYCQFEWFAPITEKR
jgi:AraC family transcriptional regulator